MRLNYVAKTVPRKCQLAIGLSEQGAESYMSPEVTRLFVSGRIIESTEEEAGHRDPEVQA
jgi:hypothetical protein